MTVAEIRADVDRGIEIAEKMAALKKEKEEIEERLVKAGLAGEQVALEDEEREGRQYLARGSKLVVPVVFTADMVVKTFAAESSVHRQIAKAAGDKLASFYAEKKTLTAIFDTGKLLRRQAAEVFGADAPAFVSACLARDKFGVVKSQERVEWGRASEG